MINKKRVFLLMLFLSITVIPFFLSGCGGVQVKQTPIQSNDKVSFIVPNNENITGFNSFLSGLKYYPTFQQHPIYIQGNLNHINVSGIRVKYNSIKNIMTIADFNGSNFDVPGGISDPPTSFASFVEYYVMVKKSSQKNDVIVTLIPYKKMLGYAKDILGVPFSMPHFNEYQLISFLKSPSLTVNFKISDTSKYNSFSTNANFVRLLKQEQLKNGVEITGRIFKMAYILPLMNNQYQAELFVSVYPYQNGSIAEVHVILPIKVKSNSSTMDLTFINKLISRAKQKIKRIVQS
jgi:hypothetical protein